MKPHSIVFATVILAGCAMSRGPAVTPNQDYQSMMGGMEAAQAQASQPGDENLSCDQLQEQMLAIAQDPEIQQRMQAAGAAAQADAAATQVGKGEIAAKAAATVFASTIPGADMTQMMAAAMENQSRAAAATARREERMAEAKQMMGFMPKMMRGQRLVELGTARKCEWAPEELG